MPSPLAAARHADSTERLPAGQQALARDPQLLRTTQSYHFSSARRATMAGYDVPSGNRSRCRSESGGLASTRRHHPRGRMPRPTLVSLPALRYWRIQRGITQAELAAQVDMRRPSVARIEAGHPALVRTAHRLAGVLGVQVADLQRQPPATDA